MNKPKTQLRRREFLLAVGAGGAGAAAVLVAKVGGRDAASAGAGAERGGAGYQPSAHVRNYYRTAKV